VLQCLYRVHDGPFSRAVGSQGTPDHPFRLSPSVGTLNSQGSWVLCAVLRAALATPHKRRTARAPSRRACHAHKGSLSPTVLSPQTRLKCLTP
jgi:hypothetical protein